MVPLSLSPRCREALLEAASSTRRTQAEQPVTVEPIIETAPLSLVWTTPPNCGCEERAG